jgi:hypothetical protein
MRGHVCILRFEVATTRFRGVWPSEKGDS